MNVDLCLEICQKAVKDSCDRLIDRWKERGYDKIKIYIYANWHRRSLLDWLRKGEGYYGRRCANGQTANNERVAGQGL